MNFLRIGTLVLLIFVGILSFAFVFVYFIVPETNVSVWRTFVTSLSDAYCTQGLSLEEVKSTHPDQSPETDISIHRLMSCIEPKSNLGIQLDGNQARRTSRFRPMEFPCWGKRLQCRTTSRATKNRP